MKRRRDDARYLRSAAATLAFYGALCAALAAVGYAFRWWALGALGGLLVFLYRGALFGIARWPERASVETLLAEERRSLLARASSAAEADRAR